MLLIPGLTYWNSYKVGGVEIRRWAQWLCQLLWLACALPIFGGGGGWKRKTLEILLCGALTLTFASALEYVGWPKSLSVAIGGGVGLIGVDAIRGAAMRVIGNKFGGSKE